MIIMLSDEYYHITDFKNIRTILQERELGQELKVFKYFFHLYFPTKDIFCCSS